MLFFSWQHVAGSKHARFKDLMAKENYMVSHWNPDLPPNICSASPTGSSQLMEESLSWGRNPDLVDSKGFTPLVNFTLIESKIPFPCAIAMHSPLMLIHWIGDLMNEFIFLQHIAAA